MPFSTQKMRWIKQSQGVLYNADHVMIMVLKKTKFDKKVLDDIFTQRKHGFFEQLLLAHMFCIYLCCLGMRV